MGEYHTGLLANAAVANGSMALPASSLQGMSAQ
jgi:hypothetical protein